MTLENFSWGFKNFIPEHRMHLYGGDTFKNMMASRPVLLLLPKDIQDAVKKGLDKKQNDSPAVEDEDHKEPFVPAHPIIDQEASKIQIQVKRDKIIKVYQEELKERELKYIHGMLDKNEAPEDKKLVRYEEHIRLKSDEHLLMKVPVQ